MFKHSCTYLNVFIIVYKNNLFFLLTLTSYKLPCKQSAMKNDLLFFSEHKINKLC